MSEATVSVTEFWRVGRRAGPLRVLAEYQGAGRFDDPERLVAVLYGAPTLRTCLLEFLLPWKAAPGAEALLTAIPEPTDEAEAIDAARDNAVANESRRVPPMLYDRVAVQVRAVPALTLLDLRSIAVRQSIALEPAVAHELRCWGYSQLDRGALLAPQRALTQTVTGVVLRGKILWPVDGLYAESRHDDDVVAVFVGGLYAPQLEVIVSDPLTPTQSSVILVANELDLTP